MLSSPEATLQVDEVTPSNDAGDACAEVPKKKKPSQGKSFIRAVPFSAHIRVNI